MYTIHDNKGNVMAFARLSGPTRMVRYASDTSTGIMIRKPFDHVIFHYSPNTPDAGPETICLPARKRNDGRIRIASFEDMLIRHDKTPDFKRYAEELSAEHDLEVEFLGVSEVIWP